MTLDQWDDIEGDLYAAEKLLREAVDQVDEKDDDGGLAYSVADDVSIALRYIAHARSNIYAARRKSGGSEEE